MLPLRHSNSQNKGHGKPVFNQASGAGNVRAEGLGKLSLISDIYIEIPINHRD